ncbi:hypothetical protein [Streptomyces coeruleorubidus]|uniref:hypothetical protein n=1 Tax=Streptomyces coeruleorubidus TaxID=116188 RepID=UPI0034113CA0
MSGRADSDTDPEITDPGAAAAQDTEPYAVPDDEPRDADEPDDVDEPRDADEPDDVDEPHDADEPDDVDEPHDADEPDDVDEPRDADEPDDVDEPHDVDEPDDVDDAEGPDGADDAAEGARRARWTAAGTGAVLALAGLAAALLRLTRSAPALVPAAYAGGAAVCAGAAVLGSRGRTRRALWLLIVGVMVMALGDQFD